MAYRTFLFVVGWISLGLGILGIALPLLPTTPFLLLSTWCFMRSSERCHRWLTSHALFGPIILEWTKRGAIRRKSKVIAILMIFISVLFIWYVEIISIAKWGVSILLTGISLFILTRPE